MKISAAILSNSVNTWIFSTAGRQVFLVGGYIRDLLRGIISKDKDFILHGSAENIARETAGKFSGTFVTLKPEMTYRVVLKNKEILDFSNLQGSINEDLKRRDFTVNAIAWSPVSGIIDPFGGREDINEHIIKAVRMKNLSDDPLRIIRAYRLAAELNFKIEPDTRRNLKHYRNGLAKVASERITEEIFKILKNKNAVKCLSECRKDKVLEKVFHADSRLSNMKLLAGFDVYLKNASKKIKELLSGEISQGLDRAGLIRLALLLPDHDDTVEKTRLKVSRSIRKALGEIHCGYSAAPVSRGRISKDILFKIFNASGGRVFEVCILLSLIKGYNRKTLLGRADEYLKIKNKVLLNGNDIQKILKIYRGRKIGGILSAVQKAQFKGEIKTRTETKKWLLHNFQ
ncbi:MAG: CCA tRNA nucleotidyltransferase [Nitrospirae bacterium]|nr:CCA tRNA nucleotidyltransferase [Nitrospirota bacterium]